MTFMTVMEYIAICGKKILFVSFFLFMLLYKLIDSITIQYFCVEESFKIAVELTVFYLLFYLFLVK